MQLRREAKRLRFRVILPLATSAVLGVEQAKWLSAKGKRAMNGSAVGTPAASQVPPKADGIVAPQRTGNQGQKHAWRPPRQHVRSHPHCGQNRCVATNG